MQALRPVACTRTLSPAKPPLRDCPTKCPWASASGRGRGRRSLRSRPRSRQGAKRRARCAPGGCGRCTATPRRGCFTTSVKMNRGILVGPLSLRQQFPLTLRYTITPPDFTGIRTVRTSNHGDSAGVFGLGGNSCRFACHLARSVPFFLRWCHTRAEYAGRGVEEPAAGTRQVSSRRGRGLLLLDERYTNQRE